MCSNLKFIWFSFFVTVLSFSSCNLQKSNFETSSKAAVGLNFPPCQMVSCALSKTLIKSSRETSFKSFSESPLIYLYFGAFPYLSGMSAITLLSRSLCLNPATSKAVLVVPATTIAYFALLLFALPNACSIACLNSASEIPSLLHSTTKYSFPFSS